MSSHGPSEESLIKLSDGDYARLAELRRGLRAFLHWSGDEARRAGVTPAQHQLLLAIRATSHPEGPSIGEVAAELLIRHHSAVELADRAQEAGLITRRRDPDQHSQVRLSLTPRGERTLQDLSEMHVRELRQLAPAMLALWPDPGETGVGSPPG